MARKPNDIEKFWQELKRRKVVQIITVYVAIAFGILQLVDIISPSLHWPDWTMTFVFVLLCIGFIITVFLSWVYDITPAGVKKTKPVSELKHVDHTTHAVSSGWKIATYISAIIIVALVAFNFISKRNLNADILKLEKSIAVLPFINDSPSDSTTYFINGLMDEILNNLQKIGAFSRVLSRTSTTQYASAARPTIPEIAKKLGVNYIVEGSGQKYGNTFRLRVQLIEAVNDKHLWAESYEQEIKETKEIFKIQSQIAESIAAELKTALTPQEKRLFEKSPTSSIEAYDAYLKGRFYYEKNIGSATKEAIKWFEESIRLDSTFALPWTYLSMCFWRSAEKTDSPLFNKAKKANEKSLELDPSSGIAIANMAEMLDNEYNFKDAEEQIKLALKIDPDNPYVLRNAGRLYTLLGREEESISFCIAALKNDPNNHTALSFLFDAYYFSGHIPEAWKIINEMRDLGFDISSARYYRLLLAENKLDSILSKSNSEGNNNSYKIALTAANFKVGNKIEAEKMANKLIEDSVTYYMIAYAYSFGDDPEKVCSFLEKSYTAKEILLRHLKVDPAFIRIRKEHRYKNIINKMKFPD
jgi:adenylate cyclase